MKIKLAVFLLLILAVNSFPQKENFDIEISLPENNFWELKKHGLLTVKLVNKSGKKLNTKNTGLNIFFSKCSKNEKCEVIEDKFGAGSDIEEKHLKENEAFDFNIDLRGMYWKDLISSIIDIEQPNNFEIVPAANKYLYAVLIKEIEYNNKEENSSGKPIYKRYTSNEILLDASFK